MGTPHRRDAAGAGGQLKCCARFGCESESAGSSSAISRRARLPSRNAPSQSACAVRQPHSSKGNPARYVDVPLDRSFVAGPSICREDPAQESGIRNGCHSDIGAGNWRKHSHLQRFCPGPAWPLATILSCRDPYNSVSTTYNQHYMRSALARLWPWCSPGLAAAVTPPKDALGFNLGDDYQIANYTQLETTGRSSRSSRTA